jgi:hypothetical protein
MRKLSCVASVDKKGNMKGSCTVASKMRIFIQNGLMELSSVSLFVILCVIIIAVTECVLNHPQHGRKPGLSQNAPILRIHIPTHLKTFYMISMLIFLRSFLTKKNLCRK